MPPRGPDDEERRLLAAAMAGARPLADQARNRVRPPKDPGRSRPQPLVPPVTSRPVDEPASPARAGLDPHLVKKLRRGQIPVEGRVDLHGMRTVEAFRALVRAVDRARQSGRRCLLVVHGKGNHSEAGGVLGTALRGWLEGPPLDRAVLCAATARPADGGDGATYLLLRKD